MSTLNKACCTLPPVQTEYTPKGVFEQVNGLKSYVTGDRSSKHVLLCIYDIFGYWATTQQGADLLGDTGKVKVVMPDFLRGQPWPIDKFPPPKDEQDKFSQWLDTIGSIPDRLKDIDVVVAGLKAQGAEKIGLYGFCWGGKISLLASRQGSPFVGTAQVHPAFVSPEDAKPVAVPLAFFPSGDEPEKDVNDFWNTFKESNPDAFKKSVTKYYTNMHHGFAAARADLNKEENYFAFQDVYTRLADYFAGLL
ncbi:carboxymethylenebutenolidase [Malassezia sp. CBS 17886]|nr:carboxymethylenebutenolidase [Malassezia sp. CBS 17886]